MTTNASASSEARRPAASLFNFGFKPVPSTSSPSIHARADSSSSADPNESNGARSHSLSLQSEELASDRSNTARPVKGSRPGRVAKPGAGLAVLRRMATAPAALPASKPRAPSSTSSKPLKTRAERIVLSPSPPTLPQIETVTSEGTPMRAMDKKGSASTPRGVDVSSPSRRLVAKSSPPVPLGVLQRSSSSRTSLTGEDTDSDKAEAALAKPKIHNSASSSRRAATPILSSDEDDDVFVSASSARSSHSASLRARSDKTRHSATPTVARKPSTPTRRPSNSPPPTRLLRSASKVVVSRNLPSPALSTRSATRLRSQSIGGQAIAPPIVTLEESPEPLDAQDVSTRQTRSTPKKNVSTTPLRRSVTYPTSGRDSLPLPDWDRTPRGGSRFNREPSGSPLSELGPSPVKQTRTRSVKSETCRPHSFELVVEVPAKRWRSRRTGSIRREREQGTSEYTDRASDAGDEPIKEENEGEEGGDEEADHEKGNSQTESVSPPPVRAGGSKSKKKRAISDSEMSASESSEEEEDDVLAALARARARVAAGQALVATSPDVSGVSTAPTTASSAHLLEDHDEDHVRRSTRTKHQPRHLTPTAVMASSSRGTGAQLDVKGKGKGKTDGDKSFERMMKELHAQQAKGRGKDWYAAKQRLISKSDDDLDGSSDDEDLPDLGSATHLDVLAQGIAGAVSEDDLHSPDKLAHKKRAKEVASILGDEETKRAKAGLAGETIEERAERTIWKASHRYELFDVENLKGEGWLGRIAKAIKDGITSPQRFPSAIILCSRVGDPRSTPSEDSEIAVSWLSELICHPATPPTLADKLYNLFHRIIQQSSPGSFALLDGDEFVQRLVGLGGHPTKLLGIPEAEPETTEQNDEDDLMDLEELELRPTPPPRRPSKALTEDVRNIALERWCRVVQVVSSKASCVLKATAIGQLVEVCVKLSLEPTMAVLRGPLERTLLSLLHSPAASVIEVQSDVFHRLAQLYRPTRPRTQFEVLASLPHRSASDKNLRKWLAWAFMAEDLAFEQAMKDEAPLSRPLLPVLLDLVRRPPPSSAFNPPANSTDSSNDVKLFQQATLLLISFTDLDDQLNVGDAKTQAQEMVDDIKSAVKKIDGKLRADARKGLLVERIQAKNLLTSITNSLDYQLRRSRGQQAGVDVTDYVGLEDADETDADAHKSKKVKRDIESEGVDMSSMAGPSSDAFGGSSVAA